jgi:hypothetical protein
MRLLRLTLLALLLGCQMAAAADPEDAPAEEAPDPWVGCWSRLYDQAHLNKHPGQLVTALTVAIDPRTSGESQGPGAYSARVAANFRGKPETYTTPYSARCGTAGTDDRLRCFLDGFFVGQFSLERAGKNIKLALPDKGDSVALVPGVELSAFVMLTPQNPEHSVFLLNPAPKNVCGQ